MRSDFLSSLKVCRKPKQRRRFSTLADRIAPVVKMKGGKKNKRRNEKVGGRGLRRIPSRPTSLPVEKKSLRCGGPADEEMRDRRTKGEEALRSAGDARAATIGFPIAPAHLPSGPAIYAEPYGGEAVYKLGLNCFTTIVCTDLFDKTRHGRAGWIGWQEGGEEEGEKENSGATLLSFALRVSFSLSVLLPSRIDCLLPFVVP